MHYNTRCSPRDVAHPGPMVWSGAPFVTRFRPRLKCVPRWTRCAFAALADADAILCVAVEIHNFTSCRGAVETRRYSHCIIVVNILPPPFTPDTTIIPVFCRCSPKRLLVVNDNTFDRSR